MYGLSPVAIRCRPTIFPSYDQVVTHSFLHDIIGIRTSKESGSPTDQAKLEQALQIIGIFLSMQTSPG